LRFYQIDTRDAFGYDQVDNAWAAKSIIVDHKFPLIGMAAKANSGVSIAPAYYYLIAVVYWATNLDPIASGLMAGLTSIFTFWVLFYIAKKMFSKEVAAVAIFLYTFVPLSIFWDRVQVPTNFIAPIALLIFYVLYRITQGDVRKIIILAILVGFSFNIHFTSVFYPIMIVLTLPFFPRTKETLKYILISIPVFLVWILPVIAAIVGHSASAAGATSYLQTNYHGFHLRRVIQLTGDGLIQLEQYFFSGILKPLKYIAIPVFYVIFLYKSITREKLIFCYLVLLWFVVPWFGFATYSGEITDYYFSISRFIALLIIAYFFARFWTIKNIIPKIVIILVLLYIGVNNFISFIPNQDGGVAKAKIEV
jgi:4-amino-4-deoxy-L-arabinose transferase-like glycosyltransferase